MHSRERKKGEKKETKEIQTGRRKRRIFSLTEGRKEAREKASQIEGSENLSLSG